METETQRADGKQPKEKERAQVKATHLWENGTQL